MSSSIYWGNPGSYKTSSAVLNDLPDFAFAGRKVVTNVRGLTDTQKVKRALIQQFKKDIPDSFEIIHVESESIEGRDKWARFFHWAPVGCAFIVDEAQDVWKRKWTQTYLNTLDYTGGADQAVADGRPLDFATAFDKHRHYNWDFVLTTPHIKKIRDEIREICDFAYKHRNQSLCGLSKKFNKFGHDPENNCRNDSDVEDPRYAQTIPSWVFDLYESTATGSHSDTRNGYSWWKKPKFLMLVLAFVVCWGYAASQAGNLKERFVPSENNVENNSTPEGQETVSASSPSAKPAVIQNPYFEDLANVSFFYSGRIKTDGVVTYLFSMEGENDIQGSVIDGNFITSLGYSISPVSSNLVLIQKGEEKYFIRTKGKENEKKLF